MAVVIIIILSIITWNVKAQTEHFPPPIVCRGLDHIQFPYDCSKEPCSDTEDAPETCRDLGDGINRCYWTDKDVVYWGDDFGENRICGYDGDAECIELDGTMVYLQDSLGGALFGDNPAT
eukprot:856348_1